MSVLDQAAVIGGLGLGLAATGAPPQSAGSTDRQAAPAVGLPPPPQNLDRTFVNPLWPGADPYVVRHGSAYYQCASARGRIEVWRSDRMTARGERVVVWRAPVAGWNRAEVWAPELHFVRGRWFIYYAASAGQNESHRMGVLEAVTDDPQGAYVDRGLLYTGDDPACRENCRWAIDGTVLDLGPGRLYFCWSGWAGEKDEQSLYLAPMASPTKIAGPRVKIDRAPVYPWERVGEDRQQRALYEGPAFLRRNGRVFLIYSCSGSWQATYKLGMMWADERADLLNPSSWTKLDHPAFESAGEVFGVGHCSFTTSPDGREDWIAYHSKTSRREGWNRVVRMQPIRWTEDGMPDLGRPLPDGARVPWPSGQGAAREALGGTGKL